YVLFIFFFQAEDGIRGFHVTGVQTCALPICLEILVVIVEGRGVEACHTTDRRLDPDLVGRELFVIVADALRRRIGEARVEAARRSEERRVGKYCRYLEAQ